MNAPQKGGGAEQEKPAVRCMRFGLLVVEVMPIAQQLLGVRVLDE